MCSVCALYQEKNGPKLFGPGRGGTSEAMPPQLSHGPQLPGHLLIGGGKGRSRVSVFVFTGV